MPTLASVLRAELRRLTSRELKKALTPLRRVQRQVRALRQVGRANRRALSAVQRNLTRLASRAGARGPGAQGRGRGFTPDAIRSLRSRLGMTRLQFAKLLGVSPGSIFGWETGRTVPRGGSTERLREASKMGLRAARTQVGARGRRRGAKPGPKPGTKRGRRRGPGRARARRPRRTRRTTTASAPKA